MAKSTLSGVLSVIASRLQQLYLNDLQRLWFKGFGFKVSGLFSFGKKNGQVYLN